MKILRKSIEAMRPHQWTKNLLIFAPLVFAHKFRELDLWLNCFLAFLSFCLLSSSVYLFNDLFDLKHDRIHPTKQRRPLASGELPAQTGLALAVLLLLLSVIPAVFLPAKFFLVPLLYLILNVLYSTRLKRIPIVDVFVLTSFYVMRLVAGGLVTDIPLSSWLKLFSFFLFLSLAFLKRHTESAEVFAATGEQTAGRGYALSDAQLLVNFGAISGFLAGLVFSLYLFQAETVKSYSRPQYLWLISPIFLFWMSRVWFRAGRGELKSDSVRFLIKDPESLICLAVVLLIGLASI
jgi:4-hydroxybenzoate polyprenyltransferase